LGRLYVPYLDFRLRQNQTTKTKITINAAAATPDTAAISVVEDLDLGGEAVWVVGVKVGKLEEEDSVHVGVESAVVESAVVGSGVGVGSIEGSGGSGVGSTGGSGVGSTGGSGVGSIGGSGVGVVGTGVVVGVAMKIYFPSKVCLVENCVWEMK
jgi:hypothetical protein